MTSINYEDYDRNADARYSLDDPLRTSDFKDMETPEVRMTWEDVQRVTDTRYLSAIKVARWLTFNTQTGPSPEDYASVIQQNPRTGAQTAIRFANIRDAIFGTI